MPHRFAGTEKTPETPLKIRSGRWGGLVTKMEKEESFLRACNLAASTTIRLTYSGNGGANYALEFCSGLADPKWVSLSTYRAPNGGVLVITNTPRNKHE